MAGSVDYIEGMKTRNRKWLRLGFIVLLGVGALWVDLPNHSGLGIGAWQRDLKVKLGLDLQGGSQLIYRAGMENVPAGDRNDALAGVRDVIERRVNLFGVSEPIIRTNHVQDEWRVMVELAGVHDPNEAIKLIGTTPQLDFRREVSPDEALENFNIDNPESLTGPVFERTELTGRQLKRSTVVFDPVSRQPQVNLEFDEDGRELFSTITREEIGKRLAIYLDGVPISAPVVQQEISNGQAVISGGFALEEAKTLARRLNAGALPVPIELIGQQSVGPTLGKISVQKSIEAGVIGLIGVMIWMIVYYRLPGVIASLTLVLYALYFLAIVKLIPITLTLAGIAGFILTVGMAVDANVLIFERFRENLRAGRTAKYAMTEGFDEAWGSIRDSNVSSLLTAVVLYGFGSSLIRGFALTFAVGVMLSMFTAITVTRTLMQIVLAGKWSQRPWLLAVKKVKESNG